MLDHVYNEHCHVDNFGNLAEKESCHGLLKIITEESLCGNIEKHQI